MYCIALLLAFVACAYASSVSPYDQCYREGDLILDRYNRCKYRECSRVVPDNGYGHLELVDKECPEGTGVPYFLLQQYMHGVYAGHRFIGSHLASTVCGDNYVKSCEVSQYHPGLSGAYNQYGGYQRGHPGVYQSPHYAQPAQPAYYQPGSYQPAPYYQPTTYGQPETEATPAMAEEEASSESNSSEE